MITGTKMRTFAWGTLAWCIEAGSALGYKIEVDSSSIRSRGDMTIVYLFQISTLSLGVESFLSVEMSRSTRLDTHTQPR